MSLGRKASVVGGGTLVSRLLGLGRDQIFAALLGAGALADAFQLAFRVPHLLRDLLGEGALSGAVTPALTRARERGQAFAVAHEIVTWLLGLVVLIALALGIAAPFLFSALLPEKAALTTDLARLMLPFLPLVVLAAVSMSLLHAHDRFGAPAFASACFNLAAIAVALVGWGLGARGSALAVTWALGTVAGGVAQLAIQLPSLWGLGFRPALSFRLGPEARRALIAFVPAVLGLAAIQVNLLVTMGFAAATPGAASHLAYAFRFLQLPIGLSGVAVGLVSGVEVARAAARGESTAADVARGLRLVVFVTLPATVGLWVLATPIIGLVFEHGAFGPGDTAATAGLLRALALGLVAYGIVKVLAPALYAVGRVRQAVAAAAAAIGANVAWCLAFPDDLGLGLSIGAAVNALVLLAALVDRALLGELRRLVLPLAAMMVGALACGVAAAWTAPRLGTLPACLAGAVVYAVAALAFRLDEARALVRRR
jgi:putative peptidoglycan lipid II flippase